MTLEQQLAEIFDAFKRQTSAQLEERLKSLANEASQAAASDRAGAIRELRLAADAEIARRSQETAALAQAETARRVDEAVAATRVEYAKRVEDAAANSRAQAVHEHEAALSQAAREHEAVLSQAKREHEAALSLAVREHEVTLAQTVRSHEAALAQTVREHETARAETVHDHDAAMHHVRDASAAQLDAALAAARAEVDSKVESAVAAARTEAESTARLLAERALAESRVSERQSGLAALERIVDAVRRFDQARTLTEVLDVLGDVISREAPRVALFLVRGSRLAGWRATGFGRGFDPRTTEVANDQSSLLWRAVASGSAISTASAAPGDRLVAPFGDLPDDLVGLAVPVRVGGETVAVIYADDVTTGPRQVPSAWPEIIEVLARHTGRCLEVLTMSRATSSAPAAAAPATAQPAAPRPAQPERAVHPPRADDDDAARRYARLLVSEIKLYHESAVAEGRHDHNLADRLRAEIDRARRLYEDRVPAEIRARTDFFDQELVRTLANGDPALLGASRT